MILIIIITFCYMIHESGPDETNQKGERKKFLFSMSSCDDDDDDEDPSFDSLSCLGFQFYTFRQTNAHIIYNQSAKKKYMA